MSFDWLPTGWAIANVSETVGVEGIISDGDWVESKDQDPNGDVRLIQLADIGDGDFRNKSERFMAKPNAIRMNCTFLKDGDVLIARMPDPLGRACIFPGVGQDAVTVVDVCLIRLPEGSALQNKILMYWVNNLEIRNGIALQATGTTRKRITRKKLEELDLPIPPLAEQHQIAAKLDELLAQVNSIKTRLDAIPNILKRFRQSVLAAAVSGKLTEDWRINNFPEMFLRSEIGQEEFRGSKLADLPRNWKWLRFDQVAKIAANLQDPLLNPNAIHIAPNHIESGSGKLFDYQTVLEDQVTSPKHRFYEGQILYSKIRPYLCKVVIANFPGLCSADMYPIDSLINTEFLFRWMLTSQFTDWVSNAESRSVLPKINQKDLSKIPVPTPPLEEQIEIVRRVEQLFAYANQIEQRVKDAQARVNHLTQSILAKAFRGELTADWRAQNPDLISGENSAESLLERIKAERKPDKSSGKTRKNRD